MCYECRYQKSLQKRQDDTTHDEYRLSDTADGVKCFIEYYANTACSYRVLVP